ncbi:MAG: prolipoprotein diacylglyceryl transferase [Pseudomonadota bacterium]
MITAALASALPFPQIGPDILSIGPLTLRYYSMAYVLGILLGWWYARKIGRHPGTEITPKLADDFMLWATLGVIFGGRIGYVLFYLLPFAADRVAADPLVIFRVWEGGMSFHGGLTGVIVAMFAFSFKNRISVIRLGDMMGCVAPVGLLLGRIANFINGELYGRVTDVPWAVIFPTGGPMGRHPSQLYEALLEGAFLLVVQAFLFFRRDAWRYPGLQAGIFLLGYATARMLVEQVREPDSHISFLFAGVTMGQLLSVPMVLGGAWLVHHGLTHKIKTAR